jgi:hypothetical protein
MESIKEEIVKMVQSQPDDSTYDKRLRELSFKRMVEKGLEDSHAGRTISNDEMKKRMRSW